MVGWLKWFWLPKSALPSHHCTAISRFTSPPRLYLGNNLANFISQYLGRFPLQCDSFPPAICVTAVTAVAAVTAVTAVAAVTAV